MNVSPGGRIVVLLVLASALVAPQVADAVPVEYRFSGLLSGMGTNLFDPVHLIDAPFEVVIAGDTDGAFDFGQLPGFGSAWVNDSASATWTVEGGGTSSSVRAQVFALPGVAAVGFAWNGDVLPVNSTDPAELALRFSSGVFATELDYGRLGAVVQAVPLTLRTDLENPPGIIPAFTKSILFPDRGRLILLEIKDVRYEVVAVPEPGTGLLTAMGVLGLCVMRRKGTLT